jgi:ATP-dependent protease ClpP protease subunit
MFKVDTNTGEIFIYDEIGPEWAGMIDDGMVIDALEQLNGKRALVRLNTPGGFMDVGVGIVNALRRYDGGVDTVVDSLAASMGTVPSSYWNPS